MPYLTHQVVGDGAVIELSIGVCDARGAVLRRMGFAVPARRSVQAVVDTGSAITGIAPDVLHALDLTAVGELPILTPSTGLTAHICKQFLVSLAFAHPEAARHFPSITVIETIFTPGEDIQALLGRDLLAHCLFVYDGQAGRFALAF